MKRILNNFNKYRYLLGELVRKDIKLKYRNSVLGLFWTMLEPLLTMIVLTIVFTSLMGRTTPHYPVYILCGRLLYSYFSNGTKLALKSIRRNSAMIRKVYVPKYIYPLSSTLSGFITFLISLIVLFAVAVVQNVKPTWHILEAIFPMLTLLLLTVGVGFILATLGVFFRDTEYLWGVILTLIMYASAIFYDPEKILKSSNAWILKYNPLFGIIQNFRNAVLGAPMNTKYFAYSAMFSVVTLIIGVFMFYKKQDKFVLYI
ncbi:ABC transporter permease [Lachnoclostridium phytofermentans]|uniref:Transport permease protein n=1 Tax=Lachnoclostridium phytofermentans (strain ATCC 700394 / DSM 18823 / ISDg) TaxID=357809 RepID=A9KIN3_LACP7|nr:ABC transporter permease [Lachnoclostridium phytofermentans]ABX43896.1 ABC-2 type transporter [Lachnoclostridium phytofermentans ISDg]